MKLNIAYSSNGTQKTWTIEDERILGQLNDKRLSQEFDAGFLGAEFKGYILRIVGGQDKQGFPMKEGVMQNARVRLLLKPGSVGFAVWRARNGERRRKTIRGCIVGPDIALLNLIVARKGESELEGLTDVQLPRRLGPKRASKIRKLFNLDKSDDVRKFVIKREVTHKNGKKKLKAPKIQRLVTPVAVYRRKAKKAALKSRREEAVSTRAAYQAVLHRRVLGALQRKHAKEGRQKAVAAKRAAQ
jgi:small subunit ribosomal protein S6e